MAMSDMTTPSGRDELEALLPFYLNGTLEGEDLARLEAWLERNPDALAALAEAEEEFSATLASNEAIRPPADALGRFSAALEREAGPVRQAAAARPSLLASVWQRIAGLPAGLAWATAVVAVAFALGQAVLSPDGPPGYEIAGEEPGASDRPFVLVTFAGGATIAEIGEALAAEQASIVGGPLAGGMYRVALPAEDGEAYDLISARIAGLPIVEQVVAGRRPADV